MSLLDEYLPVYQFSERHSCRVTAGAATILDAVMVWRMESDAVRGHRQAGARLSGGGDGKRSPSVDDRDAGFLPGSRLAAAVHALLVVDSPRQRPAASAHAVIDKSAQRRARMRCSHPQESWHINCQERCKAICRRPVRSGQVHMKCEGPIKAAPPQSPVHRR